MVNMGIVGKDPDGTAAKGTAYSPPTITNIFRGYMKEAGVDIKAQGYWNVRKEVAQKLQAKSGTCASAACAACPSSSSRSAPAHCAKCDAAAKGESVSGLRHSVGCGMRQDEPTQNAEELSRERLGLLDAGELRELCKAGGGGRSRM
ncbi:unnamed protein product [Prorocentrum cordatum]|uniref:Uncharacterized protein n=1 Tax=Prorocentrum cordatum TaxID=2364126 RepID=A0ABN9U3Q7_9DINO|nr:unnamed protein product [Polarella glacialis]